MKLDSFFTKSVDSLAHNPHFFGRKSHESTLFKQILATDVIVVVAVVVVVTIIRDVLLLHMAWTASKELH